MTEQNLEISLIKPFCIFNSMSYFQETSMFEINNYVISPIMVTKTILYLFSIPFIDTS